MADRGSDLFAQGSVRIARVKQDAEHGFDGGAAHGLNPHKFARTDSMREGYSGPTPATLHMRTHFQCSRDKDNSRVFMDWAAAAWALVRRVTTVQSPEQTMMTASITTAKTSQAAATSG